MGQKRGETARKEEGKVRSLQQNQKVQQFKHEQEEGTGDCDDLLIHGQRWAGGSWIGSIMKLI